MRKYFFIFLLMLITLNTLWAATLKELWDFFISLANNDVTDGILLISEKDIWDENDIIKNMIHAMDTDNDTLVTLEEYLTYHDIPVVVADYIYEHHDYNTSRRVAHMSLIHEYTGSWDETMLVLKINEQYYSSSNASIIIEGLERMPRYFGIHFFSSLKDLFPSTISSGEFEKRYRALVDFIIILDRKNQVNPGTSSLLLEDLAEITTISWITVSEALHFYDLLNTCHYYGQKQGDSQLIIAIKQILSKYTQIMDSFSRAAKDTTLTKTLNFVFDMILFFSSNSPGRDPMSLKRKAVSSDWDIIVLFLTSIPVQDKSVVMNELEVLLSDVQLYFLIKEDLGLYLDSYFPLQYKTNIDLARIIGLYIIVNNTYEAMVVKGTGACFATYPGFVKKHEDEIVLNTILVCYGKTGSNFYKGYMYMLANATDPAVPLDEVIWIFETLDQEGVITLVNSDLPLGRIPDIINTYRDSIAFYLPLFSRVYEFQQDKIRVLDVMNNSLFFHKQLLKTELEKLKDLWKEDFPPDFYFLLKISLSYKHIFSSMDASRKNGLIQLLNLAVNYSVKYYNMLLFNLDVHEQDAFSSSYIQFFTDLLKYSGNDIATNIIFTEHYINILKDLILLHGVSDYSLTTYILLDICKANTHSRTEVALIIADSTPFLVQNNNLENIRQISIDYDYSPDIFISLHVLELMLEPATIDITLTFLLDNNYQADIKEEIFTFGLVMTNKIFAVGPVFSADTLHSIHNFLSSIKKENRRTTLTFMNQVAFLKEHINSPADMLEFAPLIQKMEEIETDLYDDFLLHIIPVFNYLINTSDDLLKLLSELEAVNRQMTASYSSLKNQASRARFFKDVLIHLTQWITSITSIREVSDIVLTPLDKWEGPVPNYFSYLRSYLIPILKGKSDQDITTFFNAVRILLDVCDNQDRTLENLKNIIGSFFAKNDLACLVNYLKEVKDRTVSLEGGKKKYLEPLTRDEYSGVQRLVCNALQRSWYPVVCLHGDILYQTNDAALLAGGTVEITLPLDNTRYKHTGFSFFIDTQYLLDVEDSNHELNGFFGAQFPVFWTGISPSIDTSIFIKLGFGGSYLNSMNLPDNPFLCNVGLKMNFDILQRIRISLRGQYQVWMMEDLFIHRWGGGLEMTYLP